MKTALKLDTLAAIPAMNAATSPVTATPSIPLGSNVSINSGIALVYVICGSDEVPSSGMIRAATMPGRITMNGIKIFGNAPMIGARRADERFRADSARWTSAKFVVQ